MRLTPTQILIITSLSALGLLINDAYADIMLTPSVSGIAGPAQVNTTARLQQAVQNLPQPLDESQALNFYNYSNNQVTQGIAPFGYFSPDISKQLIKNNSHWQMDYQVNPGPLTHITAINIQLIGEGAQEDQLQRLINSPPFKVGDTFLSTQYDDYKNKLLNEANAIGYIKASFTKHEVLINRKQNSAVITLTLDTGARYYFGLVHFSKNPLNDSFLQRFVPFGTGQPYDPKKVYQLQNDLKNSTYFSSVTVIPNLDSANESNQVPIDVHLKPGPRQQYLLGLGYGTDTGPRATLGSDWRYVNSYGHRFDTLVRLSQVQNTASAKYIIPGKHPLTDEYNINASLQTNNINQGNSIVRQLGTGYTLTRGNWQRIFSLSYQIERYSFFSNPYQTSHLLLPGLGLQNVKSNDPLFPTEGHRFNFNIIGAKEGVMADTSMVQMTLAEKWLHSFNLNNMILLRTNLGYTTIHDLNKLPLSLSYFAGGAQSVRGYGYNSLGPGRYLAVGSAEYRYRVHGNWFAATFFDVGNAFENLPTAPHPGFCSNAGAIYHLLKQGAGIGVVWNSPVGPMELTLAQEINMPGKPKRVQFNMGTDL